MIKDIISFILSDQNCIIDFQKTPIILDAKDYLPEFEVVSGYNPISFNFENEIIKLINITDYLSLKKQKLYESSKILVGEYEDKMFGIAVDRVVDIINLNDELNESAIISKEMNHNPFSESIELLGTRFTLLNIENILKNSFEHHKVD